MLGGRLGDRVRSSLIPKVIACLLVSGALICGSQPAPAQFAQRGPKLVAADAVGTALQGYSVALSTNGTTAIIGGYADNGAIGAGFVFTRSSGVWSEQAKLVGSNPVGASEQGWSVGLSGDGNTAILGGFNDNRNVGAAWIFTQSGGVWTQQGSKLVGSGATGPTGASQGQSVALSADGNTAIVGGFGDNNYVGAAWVFTQSGGVWSQQGSKLVANDAVAPSFQGASVALSADGNTAIVGGYEDNSGAGAAWVFTRSGGVWTQQGSKLVGTGAVGNANLGASVSLSTDGNTALVGGPLDHASDGAAWVFTRSGGVWTQQGSKLVGTGATGGAAHQGWSVALSADGNTATMGGFEENNYVGAAWVFSQSGGVWSQKGSKLVGTNAVGSSEQGFAVALSGDGKTVLVGGPYDNSEIGATWVFARVTATHDLNGDGNSDIVWSDTSGNTVAWLMNGAAVLSSGAIGMVPTVWSIVGQRDFDGDGKADLLWRDTSGNTAMWFMAGTAVSSSGGVGNISTAWTVDSTADFDGDGKGDLLWRDTSGNLSMWFMNGVTVTSSAGLGNVPTTWTIIATADFDGDGKADILWRDTSGNLAVWFMNGATVASSAGLGNISAAWSLASAGDFDGDGKFDLLWRDSGGNLAIWFMNGATVSSSAGLGNVSTVWSVVQTGDYNGDGKSDIFWRDTSGNTALWFMNGATVSSTGGLGNISTVWTVQSTNAE